MGVKRTPFNAKRISNIGQALRDAGVVEASKLSMFTPEEMKDEFKFDRMTQKLAQSVKNTPTCIYFVAT